ncbi:lipase member H-like [Colias croceus]|uniref:lipase member H-like n=1 Tax=Colias crocea TaxID=72248 RepID=UPI001E281946|nr:lipase member H-like [Colias croceus]
MIVLWFLCLGYTNAMTDTGPPDGFMSNCPGMDRNTTMSEKTKESLTVLVMWPSDGWFGHDEATCKLNVEDVDCVKEHIDLNNETLVFISGYLDASFSPIVQTMVQPYLERGKNVIVVEIFPILVRTYPIAARLTKPLGHILGEFLAELTKLGLQPQNLEMLGGSLGAHIAYYAATKYHELTNLKPSRITGLDPAGPCFRNLPRKERFNSDAAHHVDALHTNIDGFGIADADAHVDFYANGGEYQPYMTGTFIMPCFLFCSHVRAALYWIISHQNPDKFLAVQCDTLHDARHGNCYTKYTKSNVLGPNTNFSRPGIFYLPTTEAPPYYLGAKGLKPRKYKVNNYLLKTAPDKDIVI